MGMRADGTPAGNPLLGLRVKPTLLAAIDSFAAEQEIGRLDAARELIRRGLSAVAAPALATERIGQKLNNGSGSGQESIQERIGPKPQPAHPITVISGPEDARQPIPGPVRRFPFA